MNKLFCILLAVAVFSSTVFAAKTTLGFYTNVTGNPISGNNYIGFSYIGTTLALLSLDKTNPYVYGNGLFAMNKCLLLLSNTDNLSAYDSFTAGIDAFGQYSNAWQGTARNYVRLDYTDSGIDIANRVRWGSGYHQVLVKNIGNSTNPKIYMELIK